MIAWLSGSLKVKKPSYAVVAAGGVGYMVHISIPAYYALPDEGEQVSLHIHTHVREDVLQLFGFLERTELEMFKKLIGVNKVGPKLAIGILSGLPATELLEVILAKDVARLSSVPGLGPKTATRLILELSDKLEGLVEAGMDDGASGKGTAGAMEGEAVEALTTLGYKAQEARKAVKSAMAENSEAGLEDVIKAALARMG